MPFARTKPLARCTRPGHRNAKVVANGPYSRGTAIYQCYRCTPPVGEVHRFSVRLDGGAAVRNQPGAPDCAAHPGSSVVRNGRHGTKGGLRRQRYRCRHERCNDTCLPTCRGRHGFTPPLPRAHVCIGDACAVCREPTPIHRGRTAAARRSRIAPDVAARALSDMSLRVGYAKAGKEALEAMGVDLTVRRRQPSATPLKPRRRWSRRK